MLPTFQDRGMAKRRESTEPARALSIDGHAHNPPREQLLDPTFDGEKSCMGTRSSL